MIWPFRKKEVKPLPRLIYTVGPAFFEMQCRFGDTSIEVNKGIVAIVMDAAKKFGAADAVKIEPDGRQTAVLRVAFDEGGFVTVAQTPSGKGQRLQPDDVVIWVPMVYSRKLAAAKAGDLRLGWVGLIRAKVKPEYDLNSDSFDIICRYD